MSTPNRIGVISGPHFVDVVVSENTRTGSETHYTFEGTETEVNHQRNVWRQNGASQIIKTSLRDGNFRVEAMFPFNEYDFEQYPMASIHELDVNILQPSIWQSPQLPLLGLDAGAVGIIQDVINDYNRGLYPRPSSTGAPTQVAQAQAAIKSSMSSAGYGSNAQIFAAGLFTQVVIQGLESYLTYLSIYKRTLTAAQPNIVQASYSGVGQIWTTNEVMNFEELNPNGWFQLAPNQEWLKSAPQVVAVTNQKTQLVYSYTQCLIASGYGYSAYGAALLRF